MSIADQFVDNNHTLIFQEQFLFASYSYHQDFVCIFRNYILVALLQVGEYGILSKVVRQELPSIDALGEGEEPWYYSIKCMGMAHGDA